MIHYWCVVRLARVAMCRSQPNGRHQTYHFAVGDGVCDIDDLYRTWLNLHSSVSGRQSRSIGSKL